MERVLFVARSSRTKNHAFKGMGRSVRFIASSAYEPAAARRNVNRLGLGFKGGKSMMRKSIGYPYEPWTSIDLVHGQARAQGSHFGGMVRFLSSGTGSSDDDGADDDGSKYDNEEQQQDDGVNNKDAGDVQDDAEVESEVVVEAVVDEETARMGVLTDLSRKNELIPPISIPPSVDELLVLAVDQPVLPGSFRVIHIEDEALIRKITAQFKIGLPWIGAFFRKSDTDSKRVAAEGHSTGGAVDNIGDIYTTGVFCQVTHIHQRQPHNANNMSFIIHGVRRVSAISAIDDENATCLAANVENVEDTEYSDDDMRIKAYHKEIMRTITDTMQISPTFNQSVQDSVRSQVGIDLSNPSSVADLAASLSTGEAKALQSLLEEPSLEERQIRCLELLKQDYLQAKLQRDIGKEVEETINKRNREHMLREQLKIIKKELGITKDDKDALGEKFRSRLKDLTVPEEVSEVIDQELNKLGFLDQDSSEFNVTRNYLDWLTSVPWGKTTEESLDIDSAQSILDEDHYGMKDVKDRVLEFIAVGTLRGTVQGKILCFVGPPGVGKTSIAKSIGRALNRQYYRFSVGGLHDVAEIKGHRRTYVGAMPGKLIQCLKKAESENPLVCIDEIDKVGRGHTGDPTSALLELLDPEQNASFMDHYLDVPVDLSKVLFVCTANTTDTIPGPLLDRMEVIQLSGYMASEKLAIAENYIIPNESQNAGIGKEQIEFDEDAIETLISQYCRESGVRNLQKQIQKLYRKSALQIVRNKGKTVEITTDNLKEFVGNPLFTSDRIYEDTPPGVIMGLAWTSMGGSSLYVETVTVPTSSENETGGLTTTGQLGDVMKESCQIAYNYAKSLLRRIDPSNDFFDKHKISLHVPEGATPKDGPSAGITIVSALMSLALDKPAVQNLAMTGEISLTGKVLRVGGLKEKILAARRADVTKLVVPEGCRPDYDDLEDEIKEGLDVHFASTYDDVYKQIF